LKKNEFRQTRRLLRLGVAAGAVGVLTMLPLAASAGVTGGCSASATIGGVTYTPGNDTPDNPVLVPADQDGVEIPWTGSVPFENKNHNGELRLALPIGSVQIAAWGHPNEGDDRAASGTYALDSFWEMLGFRITGMYTVSGFHDASGGSCTGFAVVKFTGSPLGTPVGIVVVAGAVVTGIMTLWAGVPKKGS